MAQRLTTRLEGLLIDSDIGIVDSGICRQAVALRLSGALPSALVHQHNVHVYSTQRPCLRGCMQRQWRTCARLIVARALCHGAGGREQPAAASVYLRSTSLTFRDCIIVAGRVDIPTRNRNTRSGLLCRLE